VFAAVRLARIEKSISGAERLKAGCKLSHQPSRLVNIQSIPTIPRWRAPSLIAWRDYIEQNLQARWTATQKAADWLSQQLSGGQSQIRRNRKSTFRIMRGATIWSFSNRTRNQAAMSRTSRSSNCRKS